MTTCIEGVEVELGRLDADWRKFGVKVKVHSQRRPGLKSMVEVDPGKATTAKELITLIEAAGGAGAEYLGQRYRDNIDPTTAAAAALRAFGEECRLQKSLADGVGPKLNRLTLARSRLNDQERELLERFLFLSKRGELLTPKEVLALDTMIARIHGASL